MLNKIKKVKIKDILGVFKFLIVLIPSCIYRIYLNIKNKKLWLVCENGKMARDNGYVFYKYMKNNHPDIPCYYAIDKRCNDYNKVKEYGNIINWSSLKHYFYYMSATKNISSHKEGNPNHTLFTILHLYLNLYNNRVFLQHGVIYQNFKMFYKKNTKFKLFISGAKGEYEFLKQKYGYDNKLKYTGLARFDNLHNFNIDSNIILLIPTWRRWLKNEKEFIESKYFKTFNNLINNEELINMLEKNNKKLYFYPHISTQKYINNYSTTSSNIKILDSKSIDIQDLLKKGALLITDYSSIFTDFSYMKKPVIYYQFDTNEIYSKHYGEKLSTYFDFKRDGFGDVVKSSSELINKLQYYIENGYELEEKYLKRINNFFTIHDNKNCDRIYDEIMGVEKNGKK